MVITIGEKYEVEVTTLNFTLYVHTVNKNGKDVRKRLGFYSNMRAVLAKVVRFETDEIDGDFTMKEYLDRYEQIQKSLEEFADEIMVSKKLTRKEILENE